MRKKNEKEEKDDRTLWIIKEEAQSNLKVLQSLTNSSFLNIFKIAPITRVHLDKNGVIRVEPASAAITAAYDVQNSSASKSYWST